MGTPWRRISLSKVPVCPHLCPLNMGFGAILADFAVFSRFLGPGSRRAHCRLCWQIFIHPPRTFRVHVVVVLSLLKIMARIYLYIARKTCFQDVLRITPPKKVEGMYIYFAIKFFGQSTPPKDL